MLWHITFATWQRTAIFLDEGERRAFLRALVAAVPELLLFALVDDHLHLVVATDQPAAVAGIVLKMLRHRCESRIDAPRRTAVEGRGHLERLVSYLGLQPEKHGLPAVGALYPGGSLVDLLGARRLAGFDSERLWRHLPRRGDGWLLGLAQLGELPAVDVAKVAPARVWEAALAANFAEATGRSSATTDARAVVAHLCGHLPSPVLSELVPIAAATIRSSRTRYSLEPRAVAVTLRWLAIDAAVAKRRPRV